MAKMHSYKGELTVMQELAAVWSSYLTAGKCDADHWGDPGEG